MGLDNITFVRDGKTLATAFVINPTPDCTYADTEESYIKAFADTIGAKYEIVSRSIETYEGKQTDCLNVHFATKNGSSEKEFFFDISAFQS